MGVNVSRPRKAKWAALTAVTALALAAATVGVTFGAFAGQTTAAGNNITAKPDFRGPTITTPVLGKTAGGATGFIGSSRNYRVYANVTDVGTPPSGTATVTANVSGITTGQTAAPMTAGSYTVSGVTYNHRSAILTAGAGLPAGPQGFTVTATDVAGNSRSASGSVTIDNAQPSATNISATGGIAGRPEAGDVLTLTSSEQLEPVSILANWTGAATPVQVRFRNLPPADRVEIWDSTAAAQLPFGVISLGRTDFATADIWFQGSTMTQAGTAITITLGAPVTGTVATAGGTGTMVWTPSATALDRAGNPMSTTVLNEPAPADRDF